MKLNLKSTLTKRVWAFLISTLLLAMISACGGGNGPAGKPLGPGDGKGPFIDLVLTDGANNEITSIAPGKEGILIATVIESVVSGNPVSNVSVNFVISKNSPLAGSLVPADGFAVTDASGEARIRVIPGGAGSAGEITATATVNSTEITASIGFSSQ